MSEVQVQKGHPNGLYILFFSEMWERFCYYGMRVLLTLYLVKSLLMGDSEAALIYGAYTGLVYAAPILGGKLADTYLGYRWAVIIGAIMMSIGEFLILGGGQQMLMIGMGALILGNGYFKANISTIVGKLYGDGDPRRDSGFTIFYIGINIGALMATTIVAYIGETYGFDIGFALAGAGMLLGGTIFYLGRHRYGAAEGVDVTEKGKKKVAGPLNMAQVISIGSLALIPLCYLLILNNSILDYVFLGLFLFIAYTLITAGIKEDKATKEGVWKDRMIALVLFMIINVVFWACFEQAGTSLTLFADRNVDRDIFGWIMPASMTQFFNPFFIIVFGSIFSVMWIKLSKIGRNPSIPMKFALGIFQLGLGFLLTYVAFQFAENSLVPLLTLLFLYMLHTTGELFLSPIGLSMVTKLSPKKMAATAMGAWFLSFAIANFAGGKIAALTGEGHGGGGQVDKSMFTTATTAKEGLAMVEGSASFEDWASMATGISKDDDLAKNINHSKWLNIQDWVEVREGLSADKSFDEWLDSRSKPDTFATAADWLQRPIWDDLGKRYTSIVVADNKLKNDKNESTNPGLSNGDWNYYRGDIDEFKGKSLSLADAFTKQQAKVQASSLDKYINIFTIIGLVLIGFALLIALLSKPLNKLMHGVK